LKLKVSPLLEISDELDDETVLYRTIDFFGASSIVLNQDYMFTRADVFSDKNEGIERLLLQLKRAPSGCGGVGWNDSITAKLQHEQIKKSHYISCWSKNPESVAMWSLYSQDYCSVRIATTVKQLKIVMNNFLNKYCLSNLTENELGDRKIISVEGRIAPVTYASLQELTKKASRRLKAYRRIDERYKRKGIEKPKLDKIDKRYFERQQQRRLKELSLTCNLKDNSFKHEDEVRLAIRLAETVCDKHILELKGIYDPAHKHHITLKDDLRLEEYGLNETMPERELIDCPDDLIKSVAIDPRCPQHKAEFIRGWFQEKNIPVVDSTCFGYIADSFHVYPDK
jgi:hypothetical protein